jgi:hypothetical protein
LFGQPIQAAIELPAVLIEECFELGPGWLIDDVLGGPRWGKDMSEALQDRRLQANQRSSANPVDAGRAERPVRRNCTGHRHSPDCGAERRLFARTGVPPEVRQPPNGRPE